MTGTETAPQPETPAPSPSPVETGPSQTPAPAAESAPAEDAPKDGSLRDHQGRFSKRHRAESHLASAEDVPRIRELTKKLRTTEESYSQLQARLATLEQAIPKAPKPEETVFRAPERPAGQFAEREPSIDDFASHADPYAAWLRASTAWDRKREAWEAEQGKLTETAKQAEQRQHEARESIKRAHSDRLAAFIQKTPDFRTKLEQFGNRPVPDLASATIQMADNGPELLYSLLSQPVLMDELYLITVGKPVDQATVETTRRWLAAKVQGATPPRVTGSPAPHTYVPAPRPPSPVRAAAVATSPSESGDLSISEHAKKYRR